ncbi:pitrilysin family protein [Mesorhizobium sp. CAU 1741]|uniref:M16 family metallopeptidase n=1 Tax=Mesorhizobium sp. CAU 1741 TaxID=3140366 RepID=UPI00325B4C47
MKLIPDRGFMLRYVVAFACLAVPVVGVQAQEAAPISNFTLDNGLEVVVIPDHRAPVVTHMLWYKIGSADEDPGKSGIAHFFEHLMFKGTTNHGPGEFSARIAEIGGRENAFTSYDYTAYFQQVAPSELEAMMEFESDRMRNLVLTDEVIGPERDVVIEERNSRIENSPQALHGEELNATLYQNHPYRIPVIGWMHEMEQLNRADAVDFYDRYYAPNNAVLVVAGDVDAETVREFAEETYGKVERGPDLPPRIRPQEPEQNTSRIVEMADERVGVPSFSKRWVVPSYTSADDGEAEALDLLAEILGGGMRSRIYQELVVRQGVAASAGAFYQGTSLDDTSFGVYGAPRGEATLEDVETAIDAEIAKIVEDGVSADELEKAKTRAMRSMIFARDDQSGMARMYGATLTTGGTVEDIQEWPDRLSAVTAEQVQAVAGRYLDQRRSVTGYLLPEEDDRS